MKIKRRKLNFKAQKKKKKYSNLKSMLQNYRLYLSFIHKMKSLLEMKLKEYY